MHKRLLLSALLAIAAVGLFVACNDDPATNFPTRPSASPFAAIQVIGPDSVAAGQTAQFVASIRQIDGTTKSATSLPNLRWRSSNSSVVGVSNTGLVTVPPTAKGEAIITADIAPQGIIRGTRELVVQPAGTYRIVGSVREADAPGVGVPGARVEVIPGPNSTITDQAGLYRLYGVPPQSTIRITATGYDTLDQPLELSANATRHFSLNVNGPRLSLNGPYTIAVDTVTSCSLNSALQHRTYEAMLTTTGTSIDVVLTEPRYRLNSIGRGNRFTGRVLGGGATFTLEPYYDYYYPYYGPFYYPSVAERLGDNTYLVVAGEAMTGGTSSGLTGTLANGSITQWDSRFPNFPRLLGSCFANNIQFSVTPR